jgi:tRNA pseudouridine55 synthase
MINQNQTIEGMILVNKPRGPTSHDIVDIVRKKLNTRKVGHAGTLDPLAEGLLIILVGRCTKLFPKFSDFDKEYSGILKLGEVTSTGDSQGDVIKSADYKDISIKQIEDAFSLFLGQTEQIPPMVSAVRVNGKRLYDLARRGITVKRQPRNITINSLVIKKIDLPFVEFCLQCSKGTYVRKLAEDIGEKLSCGAHMTKILRLGIGSFSLKDAVELEDITIDTLSAPQF